MSLGVYVYNQPRSQQQIEMFIFSPASNEGNLLLAFRRVKWFISLFCIPGSVITRTCYPLSHPRLPSSSGTSWPRTRQDMLFYQRSLGKNSIQLTKSSEKPQICPPAAIPNIIYCSYRLFHLAGLKYLSTRP